MDRETALRHLRLLVEGIDKTETESDTGWWETSTGADFGKTILRGLEELIVRAVPDTEAKP